MGKPTRRKSVFRETGLFDESSERPRLADPAAGAGGEKGPRRTLRFRSTPDVRVFHPEVDTENEHDEHVASPRDSRLAPPTVSPSESPLPRGAYALLQRAAIGVLLLVISVPLFQSCCLFGRDLPFPIQGVSGGAIPAEARSDGSLVLEERDDSPTDVCFRWAQQSATVNGTLYLYGGQATTQQSQTENTWNNNFLALDLTKSWQIGGPPLAGLPQPSGPPAVALGYLWNSHQSLYLYGGEFSWKPPVEPSPFSLWEYDIHGQSWIQHGDPKTSSGENAPSNGMPVQRAAEGAGANVPSLGRGFYFGGHEDGYTTQGWSQSIPRLYLQSLLEFTFPGYANRQVDAAKDGQNVGSDGVYRNVTVGGLQADAGFTARADGLLVYVPGFGDQGILLALAGGTNDTFTQMNNVNVYDIAASSWYTQSTSGTPPTIRVSPCAVVAAAPDGSSYNIYMFGGQNLIPAGNQTQFNDMWILTVPAFQWIQVDQSGQSIPYGRSGATCNIWDGQMVMVGGYLGSQPISCESPGVYVFDLSKLQWVQQFTAVSSGSNDSDDGDGGTVASPTPLPAGTNSTGSNNPFNQQPAQIPSGLEGSYGYTVPEIVIKVIGGNAQGGATVTKPIVTATSGPLATGQAQTYTVTNSAGEVVTATPTSGPSGDNNNGGSAGSGGKGGSGLTGADIAAIVVGVVCGFLLFVCAYLLFCLFVYRKELKLYKQHVEMAQRQHRAGAAGEKLPSDGNLELLAAPGGLLREQDGRGSGSGSLAGSGSNAPSNNTAVAGGAAASNSTAAAPPRNGYQPLRRGSGRRGSSTDDLLAGQEPTFVGVMLNPRRSLRVINRD